MKLIIPQITEKSLDLTGKNRYTFKVDKKLNKPEIRKIVEKLYKVTVLKVNIINQLGKRKKARIGRRPSQKMGQRADYKKALVALKKGQKIKDFEVEKPKEEKPKDEKDEKPAEK